MVFPSRLLLVALIVSLPFAAVRAEDAVDFGRDIAPVLSKNCVACHNAKKAEGGLDLESHEALMKGGDSGDSIVAGDLAASYLLDRVKDPDDPMPPEENDVGAKLLSGEQIKTLEQWILAGAKPGTMRVSNKLNFQPLPANLRPIYALAASQDGRHMAFGRGTDVLIQSSDPSLAPSKIDNSGSAAHLDIVQSIAFSSDSNRMATGGYRNVKIWRRKNEPQNLLSGLQAKKLSRRPVSPDGIHLAYADKTGALEIVNLATGQATRFLKAHATLVASSLWLDDTRLLSVDQSGDWKLAAKTPNGFQIQEVAQDKPVPVNALQLATDRVFGIGQDGKLFRCNVTDGKLSELKVWDQQNSLTAMHCPDPSGNQLVVGTSSGSVRLVDVSGDQLSVQKQFETGAAVQSLSFVPASNRVLVASQGKPAQIWDSSTGKAIATLDSDYARNQQLRYASRNVKRQQATVERFNKRLPDLKKASEKEQAALKKVQEARDKAQTKLDTEGKAVDAAKVEVQNAEKAVAAAQAAVAAAQKQLEAANKGLEDKKKAVTAADGKRQVAQADLAERDQALAAAKDSASRAAAKIPELEQLITREQELQKQLEQSLQTVEATAIPTEILAAEVSPDGSQAVLAGGDKQLRVYSLRNGSPELNLTTSDALMHLLPLNHAGLQGITTSGQLLSLPLKPSWQLEHNLGNPEQSPFSDRITALDFSPDGKTLAVGSGPPSRFGDVHLVSVESGQVAKSLGEVHSDTVFSLKFSPDGRQLASAGADKLCKTLDVASGNALRSFEGHTHHILGLAWQDDGQVLVTASADASIKVWRAESGEQIRTIGGFRKEVTAVQFVGLTHHFVMSDASGSIRLYNADDGKQLRVFSGAKDAVFGVTVSGDETKVSAGGQLGQIWTWQLSDAKLLSTQPQAQ